MPTAVVAPEPASPPVSAGAANLRNLMKKAAPAPEPNKTVANVAVNAAKKNRMLSRKKSSDMEAEPSIIDVKAKGGFKFLSGRSSSRIIRRRHEAALPGTWYGAAKLDRDVGDTVTAIAMSEDDRCALAGFFFSSAARARMIVFPPRTRVSSRSAERCCCCRVCVLLTALRAASLPSAPRTRR